MTEEEVKKLDCYANDFLASEDQKIWQEVKSKLINNPRSFFRLLDN